MRATKAGIYAARARHVCRACGQVFDPAPRNHRRWVNHMQRDHGHRSVALDCHMECGGRARPGEGRHTTREAPAMPDPNRLRAFEEHVLGLLRRGYDVNRIAATEGVYHWQVLAGLYSLERQGMARQDRDGGWEATDGDA